jgi:hypothetical protein
MSMTRFAWTAVVALVLPGVSGLSADEIDVRLSHITALSEGKSSDTSVLSNLATMSPADKAEFMKRSASVSPPARALILFEMAKGGHSEAVAELDTRLKQHASLTGKLMNVADPLELRELVWDGREKGKADIQPLAAGILLAHKGIPQDGAGLARMMKLLTGRPTGKRVENPEIREAVTYIGCLHLRGVISSESQRELERSLTAPEDEQLRMNAAAFVAVTGTPRAAKLLVDAVGGAETYAPNLDRISRVLIAGGNFTDKQRCSFVPDMVRILQTPEIPLRNRQYAQIVATKISMLSKIDEMLAWAAKREKELEETPKGPGQATNRVPAGEADSPKPEAPLPKAPDAEPPKPAAVPGVDAECAKWLLLAKNFMNMKNYDKAEDHAKRVVEKAPQGKMAEEAREILKQIEAVKGL